MLVNRDSVLPVGHRLLPSFGRSLASFGYQVPWRRIDPLDMLADRLFRTSDTMMLQVGPDREDWIGYTLEPGNDQPVPAPYRRA